MRRTLLVLMLSLLARCAATPTGPVMTEPLTVLRGGRILAGAGLEPIAAGAVVVRGSKIEWVGPERDLPLLANARVIDLAGATVLPGLVDAHAHIAGLGAALDSVSLVGASSYAEVVDRISKRAATAAPGEWITGRGWDQNDWPGAEFPTAAPLDEAIPDKPVWVRRIDGHAGLANSAAMRAARITAETPDPPGGRILRDATGQPTGVFVDAAMDLVDSRVPPPSRTRRKQQLLEATRAIAARGLTGVHDAGVDQDTIQLLRQLAEAGELPIRVYAMLGDDDELLTYWLQRGTLVDYADLLTVRSIKLYADGALGSRGAAMIEPYSDDPGNRGLLVSTASHIEDVSRRARAGGFQVGTHAIGDRGVRTVLDAYEAAGVVPSDRFRIEHLQVVAPGDFARVARAGIIAAMQPTHATSDMPWAEARVGHERIEGAYAWRTVLDQGARLALGSDFPVEEVDPLLGLYAAVTRQDLKGQPAGGWMAEQRLTLEEAIRGFTADAAFAAFEEDRRGIIAPGYFADLTVLRPGPGEVPPAAIPQVDVVYTIVNGRIVWPAEAP